MSAMNKVMSVVATAAAIAFVTAPFTATTAQANHHQVKCYGVNSCKGKGSCKSASNACKGQNSCKGKGLVMKSAKKCKKMGGTEEPAATT